MLCEKCGVENPIYAKTCFQCKQPLNRQKRFPYAQPPSQQPASGHVYQKSYYSQPQNPQDETEANAALVCGIIGLSFAFFGLMPFILLSSDLLYAIGVGPVPGLILGVIAIRRGRNAKTLGYKSGKVIAGMVLGISAIIFGAIVIVYVIVIVLSFFLSLGLLT